MALSAPAPVLGIPGPPFAGTVLTHLPVFRIRSEFAAAGFGTPTPLTLRSATDRLTRLKLGWLEDPLTIATPPLDHTGVVAPTRQTKNLETFIESVLPPRRCSFQQQNRWECGRFIPVLTPVTPRVGAPAETTPARWGAGVALVAVFRTRVGANHKLYPNERMSREYNWSTTFRLFSIEPGGKPPGSGSFTPATNSERRWPGFEGRYITSHAK